MAKGNVNTVQHAQQLYNDLKKHDDVTHHVSKRIVQKIASDNYGVHPQSVLDARCEDYDKKSSRPLHTQGKK